jgi:hypothetical protein
VEGPNVSRLLRTSFVCPVKINKGGAWIYRDGVRGNLSLRGLFLASEHLSVDGVVHLPLFGAHRLEADGIVCHCDARGAGIEFRGLSEEQSHHVYEFIADFTPGQMLAR